MNDPNKQFSTSIIRKYLTQTYRHVRTASNARWMLRNPGTSPLSNNERDELIAIVRLGK